MPDFLLELLTEEIPARMQSRAAEQLRTRFEDGLAGRVPFDALETYATPRRLALIARNLATAGTAATEERRGPRADAPAGAIDGFLRSTGLARDQLEERDTPKGRFLYAVIDAPGRPTAALLAELIPNIIRAFDWPKSMRWGAASARRDSLRWVRPLTGIVALLGPDIVPFEVAGSASGRVTRGHRFMSSGEIVVESAATYEAQLRAANVMLNADERWATIVAYGDAAAEAAGLSLLPDQGLRDENAGLTEWPVPLLGRFDPAFLNVPPEIIQLTMRTNQKYFACANPDGSLAPAFVCVANIAAADDGVAIVAGNEKVLTARLADAKFFWDADLKAGLESFRPKLEQIVFHEKLGTVADKVERVAKLARWLVESGVVGSLPPTPSPSGEGEQRAASALLAPSPLGEGVGGGPSLADLAEQAARLCKADLTTATVGEFPEIQGIAGRYLALAEGLDPRVADAIRDHYKPVGQGDDVPTAPASVAVALADKLDTLCSFFEIAEYPTGSKDPFALRRAALGVLRLSRPLELHLGSAIEAWLGHTPQTILSAKEAHRRGLMTILPEFILDRLEVQQREAGVPHDLVSASREWLGVGDGRTDRVVKRARALQAFLHSPDGANLLSGYKRAANILRIEEARGDAFGGDVDPARFTEPAETALAAALDRALPEAQVAVAAEDFAGAMTALSQLRPVVDAFFETVIVNAPEPALRANRLNLLARLRAAVHSVADFSKIEGGAA